MTDESAVQQFRARRRRLMGAHLPKVISEFPFEFCLALWGFFAGVTTVTPGIRTPSSTLYRLPIEVQNAWGIAMFLGAITMTLALRPPVVRTALLARGTTLCAISILAFGIAVIGSVGWPRMLSGGFMLLIGAAAAIRASKLRYEYYTTLEELTVQHNGGTESEES